MNTRLPAPLNHLLAALATILFCVAFLGTALLGAPALATVAVATVSLTLAFGPAVAAAFVLLLAALVQLAAPRHAHRLGANALGTLAAAQIIVSRALRLTFTSFPKLSTLAFGMKELDGRVQQMALGQTAISRIMSLSSLGNFGDAPTALSRTDVPVTLRNFRQISHEFSAGEINSIEAGQLNLVQEAALPMATKLAQAIPGFAASLVSASNFNLTVNSQAPQLTVAANWTRANTILPLQQLANERGIPEDGRYALFNSAVYASLLADAIIVAELNNPNNKGAITSGKLPDVSGFGLDKYPQMPNTDGNLVGFCGTPDALAYVARAPMTPWDVVKDVPVNALWTIVTDQMSGFSVLLLIESVIGNLGIRIRLIWLDGLAVGNPNNLLRLLSGVAAGTAGTVTKLAITNPGFGYLNGSGVYAAPTVTITPAVGDSTGSGATATCTISNSGSSPYGSGGTGGGAVATITITAAGTLYTLPPVVTFTPAAGGSVQGPATAVATVGGLS